MESDEEVVVVSAILIEEEERRKRRRKRKCWIHNINRKRFQFGEFHTLFPDLLEDDVKFFAYYRMTHAKFEALLNIVEDRLMRNVTNCRSPVGAKERLAVCLR